MVWTVHPDLTLYQYFWSSGWLRGQPQSLYFLDVAHAGSSGTKISFCRVTFTAMYT